VVYSGRPDVPPTFPDGLEKELGGPNAVPVSWSIPLDCSCYGRNNWHSQRRANQGSFDETTPTTWIGWYIE
jgi:hypothetical protein